MRGKQEPVRKSEDMERNLLFDAVALHAAVLRRAQRERPHFHQRVASFFVRNVPPRYESLDAHLGKLLMEDEVITLDCGFGFSVRDEGQLARQPGTRMSLLLWTNCQFFFIRARLAFTTENPREQILLKSDC